MLEDLPSLPSLPNPLGDSLPTSNLTNPVSEAVSPLFNAIPLIGGNSAIMLPLGLIGFTIFLLFIIWGVKKITGDWKMGVIITLILLLIFCQYLYRALDGWGIVLSMNQEQIVKLYSLTSNFPPARDSASQTLDGIIGFQTIVVAKFWSWIIAVLSFGMLFNVIWNHPDGAKSSAKNNFYVFILALLGFVVFLAYAIEHTYLLGSASSEQVEYIRTLMM